MSSGLQFDANVSRGLELQYKRPQMVLRVSVTTRSTWAADRASCAPTSQRA
jgi:hypothetical protein